MGFAKISVLIVTYKQQDVIGRNIESILRQREYGLNEIVICDDCSPDNNWDVIQSYKEKYPDIIRAYRNDPNLGIYGNSNKLASLHGDSDLFCWIEGDDALCDGFFKSVQEYIKEHDLNLEDSFGVFCNYKMITPEGKETLVRNNLADSNYSPLGLYLRSLISWRATLFTKSVISKFTPVDTKHGLGLAEMLFDSQWFQYVEKMYYCDAPGSIYYTDIGVSTQLGDNSTWKKEEALNKWTYFHSYYAFNKKDLYWTQYNVEKAKYIIKPALGTFFRAVFCFIIGSYKENRNSKGKIRYFLYPFIHVLKINKSK